MNLSFEAISTGLLGLGLLVFLVAWALRRRRAIQEELSKTASALAEKAISAFNDLEMLDDGEYIPNSVIEHWCAEHPVTQLISLDPDIPHQTLQCSA